MSIGAWIFASTCVAGAAALIVAGYGEAVLCIGVVTYLLACEWVCQEAEDQLKKQK